jgi:Ohr subfamily peroxiredoxin
MLESVIYKTAATATGGRDGTASFADSDATFGLAPPKEFGGNGNGMNPEQLFAAGYAACFLSALKHVAGEQKIAVPADATTDVAVAIGPRVGGGFGLDVAIDVSLPGMDQAQAEALIETAHQVCPYSNATRGNIDITPRLKG